MVVAGVLSACGADGSADTGPTESIASGVATSLRIVVTPDEGISPARLTLTCDPAGGDHPHAQQACEALDAAGAAVFEPVPADRACTQVYGGPQVATVLGTYDGAAVEATFNRTNGCEIDRWEQLGATFFDVPML